MDCFPSLSTCSNTGSLHPLHSSSQSSLFNQSRYNFLNATSLNCSIAIVFTILLHCCHFSLFESFISLSLIAHCYTLTFSVVRRAGAWGFQEYHPLDLKFQKLCIILAHFNLHTPFACLFAPFLSGSWDNLGQSVPATGLLSPGRARCKNRRTSTLVLAVPSTGLSSKTRGVADNHQTKL